jgi:hypothetical protein
VFAEVQALAWQQVAGTQSVSTVHGSLLRLRRVCPQARKRKDAETAKTNKTKVLMHRA